MKRTDLTKGSITKNILVTAMPMIIAMVMHTGFNVVDAIFVGRISAEAIAAVSMAFPVMFFNFAIAGGIGIGATSIIARFFGSKKFRKASNSAEHALIIGIGIGIVLTILGFSFGRPLFVLMGAGELTGLVLDYMNIIFAGIIFMVTFVIANAILRGEGDMKTPMRFMVASTIINIILDPILIFWVGWGVKGAALATIISTMIGSFMVMRHLLKGMSSIKLKFEYFRYNPERIKQIFAVGLPASLSQMSMAVGMFLLTKIVSGFGPYAIAAFGIGFRIDSFAILPVLGLMTSIVTIVGQNVGKKNFDRANKSVFAAIKMSMFYLFVLGIILFIFPKAWILIFNNHPEVLKHGVSYLKTISLFYIFAGIGIPVTGAFLGSGHAIPAMLLTFLRVLIVSVPLAYFLSGIFGLIGVWIGIASSMVISGIVGLIWFNLGTWKKSLSH